MVSDRVILPPDAAQSLRKTVGVFAVHEEGGSHAMFFQYIEDLVRARRCRTIIKGQGDTPFPCLPPDERRAQKLRAGHGTSVIKKGDNPDDDEEDDKKEREVHERIGGARVTL